MKKVRQGDFINELILLIYPLLLSCCCSATKSCPTLCDPTDAVRQDSLHYLPELAQTQVHWVSDAIQLSHPLSSPSPPVFNLSQHQGIFQWVGSSHQGPKYWSFSFSISPSSEYSGLMISFGIDWFDLLAVQGILKGLLQHHNSKASILWHSAFFMIQLPHLYVTTGKTIVLTIWTFAGKMMLEPTRLLSAF